MVADQLGHALGSVPQIAARTRLRALGAGQDPAVVVQVDEEPLVAARIGQRTVGAPQLPVPTPPLAPGELGPADDQVAVVDAERHPAGTRRDGEADLLAVAPDSGPSGTRGGEVAHVPHRDAVVVERPNHGERSLAADLEAGGGAVVPQPGRSAHPVGVHVPTPLRGHDAGFVHVDGNAHHAFFMGEPAADAEVDHVAVSPEHGLRVPDERPVPGGRARRTHRPALVVHGIDHARDVPLQHRKQHDVGVAPGRLASIRDRSRGRQRHDSEKHDAAQQSVHPGLLSRVIVTSHRSASSAEHASMPPLPSTVSSPGPPTS